VSTGSNAPLLKRIGERDVVLSLSGGKDSTACGLWLQEQGIPFRPLFLDTGWEHRDTYAHLDRLEGVFGPITRVAASIEIPAAYLDEIADIESRLGHPSPMVRRAVRYGMFPSRMRKWCTKELKVLPFLLWCESNATDIVNVVGIRHDESLARATWPEWADHPDAPNVEVWAPITGWSVEEVIGIHKRHDIPPCPLYLRGSTRVGCWPCIHSNRDDLRALAADAERVAILRDLEALVARAAIVGHNHDPDLGETRSFFQARIEEKGKPIRYPCWPIDKVLAWANRIPRKRGWQMDLFAAVPSEAGCSRWGMCERQTPAA
jgi:3'-phosphoadenosine 5'-phosphosulfate sulfotransferase (PAPS reductase)/FAD synthetase